MSWRFFIIAVCCTLYFARGSHTSTTQSPCAFEEFRRCMQSIESLSNDFAFPVTREELLAVCSNLREGIVCIDDYIKRCFSSAQTKIFNQTVAEARRVKDDLCVVGPIQQAYLNHAPCFTNVSLSEEKCAPVNRQVKELSDVVDEEKDVEEGLRKSCCAFKEFVHCKYLHVSRDCGAEAVEFLQKHLERISSALMEEHCAPYTYGSDTCSSGHKKKIAELFLPFFLVVSMFTV